MTDVLTTELTQEEREAQAQRRVEGFVARFEPAYYELVCHVALPLVLTPELVSYLRNEFLPGLPWMAEVDLLLSELCSQVGYELYAMDTDVRAYVLKVRSQTFGSERMAEVANLLISYVRYLANNSTQMSTRELESQQWAAMVYLGAVERRQVVDEIVERFQACSMGGEQIGAELLSQSDMAQLADITQTFREQLAEYPELIKYASLVSDVQLRNTVLAAERVDRVYEVGGQQLQLPDGVKRRLRALDRIQSSPVGIADATFSEERDTHSPMASPSPLQPELDAEEISFPPLQELAFEYGEWVGDSTESVNDLPASFPPPLEPVSFQIATISVPQQTLEVFEFETAKLEYKHAGLLKRIQWVITRSRAQANRFIEVLDNALILEMVAIPGGRFVMGSPKVEADRENCEGPQHEVSVPSFFMGRYPVTQTQWRFVVGLPKVNRSLKTAPSHFRGDDRSVERVSWYEAVEFCDRLSAHTNRQYRLPTEAEWEYACRAGTTTPFFCGETLTTEVANYNGSYAYADGPKGRYRKKTTPVDALGIANAFGLCDMHGNVWEWCADHYARYEQTATDGSAFITEDEKANRIIRGGSWTADPKFCRSAYRFDTSPSNANISFGFRVSCSTPRT